MLKEEKIRQMTDLAMIEKKNGQAVRDVSGYSRRDYVGRAMLSGFIRYTVSFVVIGALLAIFHLNLYLGNMTLEDVEKGLLLMAQLYGILLIIYLIVVAQVSGNRYDREEEEMQRYMARLEQLQLYYEYHDRAAELAREETT